jgi:hypothetical protein
MPDDKPAPTADAAISLREVTADTVGPVCALSDTLGEIKRKFVATNAFSTAEAHFEPRLGSAPSAPMRSRSALSCSTTTPISPSTFSGAL